MEASKRDQLLLMAQATTMVVVAKDGNGNYWSIGAEKGAFMVSSDQQQVERLTATGMGTKLVLGGLEANPMYTVTSTIVES